MPETGKADATRQNLLGIQEGLGMLSSQRMYALAIVLGLIIASTLVGCNDQKSQEQLDEEFRTAAGLGDIQQVQTLLEQGADVNSRAPAVDDIPAGITPLMFASARNHKDIVVFLIEHGANVNQKDDAGGTALIYAVWKGHKDIVAILIDKGADILITTSDGRSPLSVASDEGHTDIHAMLTKKVNAHK